MSEELRNMPGLNDRLNLYYDNGPAPIDIGPSLSKLCREWRVAASIEVPTGMIARRILYAMVDKLKEGEKLIVERTGERSVKITRG